MTAATETLSPVQFLMRRDAVLYALALNRCPECGSQHNSLRAGRGFLPTGRPAFKHAEALVRKGYLDYDYGYERWQIEAA